MHQDKSINRIAELSEENCKGLTAYTDCIEKTKSRVPPKNQKTKKEIKNTSYLYVGNWYRQFEVSQDTTVTSRTLLFKYQSKILILTC